MSEQDDRHAGFIELVHGYIPRGLRSAERSFLAHIEEHEDKLRRSIERNDSRPLNHLEQELRNFYEQLEIIRVEMRRRGMR